MLKFPFSKRTDWGTHSNALNECVEDLRAQSTDILDLTESNPTRCGFSYPTEILPALSKPANLNYNPESQGLLAARQAVANYYQGLGSPIDPQHIVLTSSTSEAYAFLLRLLVNPGEKVLIPKPSYPLFQFLLELNDAAFEYYPLVYEGQWRLDREALTALIDENTRAIVLVNPNNPTGSYLTPEDLAFLDDICRTHRLAIISDEVFFDYAWNTGEEQSCVGNRDVLTFVLGGLSKTLALPQMKCSWILASGPQEIVTEALGRLEIIADTFLSVNTPVQNALGQWLPLAASIQPQIRKRVADNWRILQAHLIPEVELLSVQGGWYAILKVPAVFSEEEWIIKFLKEDHVLVHPGYFFDFDQEAYIIISLLIHSDTLTQAVGVMMKRIQHETRGV